MLYNKEPNYLEHVPLIHGDCFQGPNYFIKKVTLQMKTLMLFYIFDSEPDTLHLRVIKVIMQMKILNSLY